MDHGKQKFGVPFGEAPAKNSGKKVVLYSWTQRKWKPAVGTQR